MATKTRGLTRRITKKQALSYKRLIPNGLGVTAIAAVNGRGAFKKNAKTLRMGGSTAWVPIETRSRARRHAETVGRTLAKPFKHAAQAVKSVGRVIGRSAKGYLDVMPKGVRKVAGAAKRVAGRSAEGYEGAYERTRRLLGVPVKTKRKSRARIVAMPIYGVGAEGQVVASRPKRAKRARKAEDTMPKKRKTAKKKTKRTGKLTGAAKKAFLARMAKGRRAASKKTSKKVSHKRAMPARPGTKRSRRKQLRGAAKKAFLARMKKGRRAAGLKYNSNAKRRKGAGARVSALIGGRSFKTYLYKKGKSLRHLPLWAEAGAKSEAEFKKMTTPGTAESTSKRGAAARRRVASAMRARQRAAGRVARAGDIFTPNRRAVPYEEWSENMKANKKRKKAKKSATKRSTAKKLTKAEIRKRAARKAAKTRAAKKAVRVRAGKKAAATRKRHAGHKTAKRHVKRTHKKAAKRHVKRGARKAARRHSVKRGPSFNRNGHKHVRHFAANRRRKSYLPVRVGRITFNENVKSLALKPNRRHHRRHYRSNGGFNMKGFKERFITLLKVGGLAAVGFGAHRATTKLLSDQLGKVSAFQSGALATYKNLVAGLIVAGISIPALDKVLGKKAAEVNAGVFASLVHSVITTALTAFGQGSAAAALSGYADRSGRAYHGFGEYMPVSGFGALPSSSRYGGGYLSQAQAGFGHARLSQAAAGFGAPQLTQAAAGIGEYMVQGAQGIGEYEMVSGVGSLGSGLGVTDDGIQPDLASAEHALNIAEAAAGVGAFGDVGSQSQLNPLMTAQAVEDSPGGMRSGILQGGDGIFG